MLDTNVAKCPGHVQFSCTNSKADSSADSAIDFYRQLFVLWTLSNGIGIRSIPHRWIISQCRFSAIKPLVVTLTIQEEHDEEYFLWYML